MTKHSATICIVIIVIMLLLIKLWGNGSYIGLERIKEIQTEKALSGDYWHMVDGYRVDKEPIIKRFEGLGNFSKCYWKADIIGKSNFGPTSYWMKGFVVLNNGDFKKFKEQYKWCDVEGGWGPSLDTKVLEVQDFKWVYNEEFNNFINSSGYIGEFYLDLVNGIVFFDIQK